MLARILNEKGLDWVKSIPDSIGGIKHADFDDLFALFTDRTNYY